MPKTKKAEKPGCFVEVLVWFVCLLLFSVQGARLILLTITSVFLMVFQAFGFLNFVLWAGNIWFVFKETGWHKSAAKLAGQPPEKQAGTFGQQQYSPGSFDQSGSYNSQGSFSPPSEYSQVGGPTSYTNQM